MTMNDENDKKQKEFAARVPPPANYIFDLAQPAFFIETKKIGGNNIINQIIQQDNKYYRIVWQREGDAETELQKALDFDLNQEYDPEKDGPRASLFFAVLGAIIDRGGFKDGRINGDEFIKDGIKYLKREKYNYFDWHLKWFNKIVDIQRPLTFKASAHFENQKIRIPPKTGQLTLLDYFDGDNKVAAAKDIKIETVGLREIDQTDFEVIEGVQKLISATNFKGNIPGEDRQTQHFKGYVPAIEFTPAEFCECAGVPKRINKAGKMVYNRRERDAKLKRLETLPEKSFIFAITRHTWENNKENIERIHTPNARLWTYNIHYRNLTEKENLALSHGKKCSGRKIIKIYLTNICPIIIDQIDQHFIIKRNEYKALAGRSAKYETLFFTWLGIEANNRRAAGLKNAWIVKVSDRNELAYKLEMDAWINARQKKRIKEAIIKCYELVKEEGMIESFEINHRGATKIYDILVLNKTYFEEIGWKIPK